MKTIKTILFSFLTIMYAMSDCCFGATGMTQEIDRATNSAFQNWATILVPSIVTVVGLLFTNINTKKGFEEALKQKNNDQKRNVYTAAFKDIDELVTKRTIIFDTDHFDKIVSHKALIKLCGSNAVIKRYEDIFNLCYGVISPFWRWIIDNYPNDKSNPAENDYITFEDNCESYKKEHLPDAKVVSEKVTDLLNEMRKDLGNDAYS